MLRLAFEDIGGAIVRLGFNMGARRMKSGQRLSRETIMAIPIANRNSLVSSGHLEVYPRGDNAAPATAAPATGADRHLVHLGRGYYDVIEGVKLNAEPVKREEAEALAARPS